MPSYDLKSAGNLIGKRVVTTITNKGISVAQRYIDQGLDKVNNVIREGISRLGLNGLFGNPNAEDFNMLRRTVRTLVATEFQMEWLFRLEITGEPSEFDLFVKDISYGIGQINTDDEQYGSSTTVWPTGRQATRISVTVREHEDGRVRDFIENWMQEVVHPDGTVGLPYGPQGYVRRVRIYDLKPNGEENLSVEREMYPEQIGDASRSRENGNFMEMPITFVQFSTLDSVGLVTPNSQQAGGTAGTGTGGKSVGAHVADRIFK